MSFSKLQSIFKKPIFWIIFLGFLLRLIGLEQSLWLDEAIQVKAAQLPLKQFFSQYMPADFNPPLSYLITHFWGQVFGWSELSLRLPSVIFGTASIYLVYLIVKQLFSKKRNLAFGIWHLEFPEIASLLLAISGLHIYYSQGVRAYILTSFLTLASIYFYLKSLKNSLYTKYYILNTILLFYSHYLAWLIMPVFWLGVVIFKPSRKILKRFLLTQLVIILAFLPWLPTFLKQIRLGSQTAGKLPVWSQTVGSISLKSLSLVPIKFIIGRISIDNNLLYGLFLAPILLIFSWVLLKSFSKKKKVLFTWTWLFLPLALGIIISFFLPVFFYFRFLFVLPAFYILLTYGLLKFKPKTASLLFEAVLFISLICSAAYLSLPRFHRENWQKAVLILDVYNQQQAPILIIPQVSAPFDYYYQGQAQILDYGQVDQIVEQPFVWLVKYAQPIFEPENQTERLLKASGFVTIYDQDFRGVRIKKFINTNLENPGV